MLIHTHRSKNAYTKYLALRMYTYPYVLLKRNSTLDNEIRPEATRIDLKSGLSLRKLCIQVVYTCLRYQKELRLICECDPRIAATMYFLGLRPIHLFRDTPIVCPTQLGRALPHQCALCPQHLREPSSDIILFIEQSLSLVTAYLQVYFLLGVIVQRDRKPLHTRCIDMHHVVSYIQSWLYFTQFRALFAIASLLTTI